MSGECGHLLRVTLEYPASHVRHGPFSGLDSQVFSRLLFVALEQHLGSGATSVLMQIKAKTGEDSGVTQLMLETLKRFIKDDGLLSNTPMSFEVHVMSAAEVRNVRRQLKTAGNSFEFQRGSIKPTPAEMSERERQAKVQRRLQLARQLKELTRELGEGSSEEKDGSDSDGDVSMRLTLPAAMRGRRRSRSVDSGFAQRAKRISHYKSNGFNDYEIEQVLRLEDAL